MKNETQVTFEQLGDTVRVPGGARFPMEVPGCEDRSLAARRYDICRRCAEDGGQGHLVGIGKFKTIRCGTFSRRDPGCGCFMAIKSWLGFARCPEGRWGKP